MNNIDRKANADRILYELGLLKRLEMIGEPHIIGSYRMNMMAWNDLDIDIENNAMSLDKMYELSAFIMSTFKPVWYEAKEEINAEGKKVWFHGFETMITGELWNIDLWFLDKETISNAERYCDTITDSANQKEKDIIVKHMWPVTIKFPKYPESFIVTFVDKYSAIQESFVFYNSYLTKKKLYRYAYVFLCLLIFV